MNGLPIVDCRLPIGRRRAPASIGNRHSAIGNGFTIVEFMVLFGIVIILLSIFIPYLLKLRESDRRTRCAQNLYQIRDALKHYAADNGHIYPRVVYDEKNNPNGYTAFTGVDDDDPFAPGSAVQPNDVTASLWLLVRGELVAPAVFVCPSSDESRDLVTDASGRHVRAGQRGNFRSGNNLSYSYFSPFSNALNYRIDDNRLADAALMADKSPGIDRSRGDDIAGPAWNAPTIDLSRANSRNHGKAGQNVLFADGSVRFMRTAYCGVGRSETAAGDNIYTALTPKPLAGEHPPANGNGYWGHDIGPAWEGDSYLVPTATEGRGRPAPSPRPLATTTATSTTTATVPATVPAVPTTIPTTTVPTAPTTAPTSTEPATTVAPVTSAPTTQPITQPPTTAPTTSTAPAR